MAWVQTLSGRTIDPFDLMVRDIDITDIAKGLARKCRFMGWCEDFYSVAQHSVLISEWLERAGCDRITQQWGLMHDAAEAYIGDLARPFKGRYMIHNPKHMAMENIREVEARILHTISLALGLPLPVPAIVKQIDTRMLLTERKQLMAHPEIIWDGLPDVDLLEIEIRPCPEREAYAQFMDRYDLLMGQD